MPVEKIINCISANPRKVLGLNPALIKEGERADFTIFNPNEEWTFTTGHIRSLSRNTPFISSNFSGRAKAVCNNGFFLLC